MCTLRWNEPLQIDKPGTPVAAARGSRSCTPTMGGLPGPLASRVYHPPSSQQTPPQGYQGLPSRGNEPPQSPSPYSNLPYARTSMVLATVLAARFFLFLFFFYLFVLSVMSRRRRPFLRSALSRDMTVSISL